MVLHRRDAFQRLRRVANDRAVGRNERDACADERTDSIRFGIEIRQPRTVRAGRAACEQLRGEIRLRHQRAVDAFIGALPHRIGEEHARDRERDERRGQRGEEQLGAKAHGAGSRSL